MGFPGGSDGKESACSVGDLGLISWRREWLPTPVFFFFFFFLLQLNHLVSPEEMTEKNITLEKQG